MAYAQLLAGFRMITSLVDRVIVPAGFPSLGTCTPLPALSAMPFFYGLGPTTPTFITEFLQGTPIAKHAVDFGALFLEIMSRANGNGTDAMCNFFTFVFFHKILWIVDAFLRLKVKSPVKAIERAFGMY